MKFESWGAPRCRTCLNYNSDTISINEKLSFEDQNVNITLVDLINECASVELLTGDSKPQTICKVCVESARITFVFRKRCKESQLILLQEESLDSNVEIKLESDYAFTADITYSSEDEKPLSTMVSNSGYLCNKNKVMPKIRKHRKDFLGEKRKKQHSCHLCNKYYKSPKLLLLHIKRHSDPNSKIFTGIKTDESPTESDLFEQNIRLTANSENIKHKEVKPDVEGEYKCSVCNRIFTTSRNLLIHAKRHSDQTQRFKKKQKPRAIKEVRDNNDITNPDSSLTEISNEFNCTICNKHFTLHKYLVKHLKRHQASGRLSINNFDKKLVSEADLNALGKCCFCDWTGTSNELKKHKEEHAHLKTFKCHLCDKKFFESYNLQTHLMIHSGEKKHMCDFCGKSFTAKTNLKMHLRTHTGSKPYGCEMCMKTFAQQSQLTSHMFTHSQDRNYVCSLCGVTFKRKGSLRDHIRSHRPVEEWDKCAVCSKAFRTQKQLKEHMLQHTGERNHVCNVCGKDFGRKRNLSTHMKIHTGDSAHVCLVCGRAFSQKHVLLSHMKTHEK